MKESLSIVLPIFNEVKSLEHVISNWSQFLNKNNILHEFVICEDGSTDGTKELIVNLKSRYPISDQSAQHRRGYGGGVIAGITASKHEYILCIDSDGQCMPDSFLNFYNNKHLADISIGNRNPRNDPIILTGKATAGTTTALRLPKKRYIIKTTKINAITRLL